MDDFRRLEGGAGSHVVPSGLKTELFSPSTSMLRDSKPASQVTPIFRPIGHRAPSCRVFAVKTRVGFILSDKWRAAGQRTVDFDYSWALSKPSMSGAT